jgi:methyl-accepting chemotaxis protein
MNMLRQIRIGTRLAAAFGALFVLFALMAAFAVHQNRQVQGLLVDLQSRYLSDATNAWSMKEASYENAELARRMLAETDAAKIEELQRGVQALRERNGKAIKAIGAHVQHDPELKAAMDRISALREAINTSRAEAFKLLKAGNREQALKKFDNEAYADMLRFRTENERFVDFTRKRVAQQIEDTTSATARAQALMAAGFGVMLVIGLLLAYRTARSITRPLREAIVVANKVADGDLTGSIEVTSRDETGELLTALKHMNESLRTIVAEVRNGTDSIDRAAKDIASGNADLSSRTEQQASSLEETSSSMEELASSVKLNAENARQANQLASGASDVATRGGQVVQNVVNTMVGISDASKKIADITSVIDGIAFQTNILALNAAVEAARAGEQGRGFAVVAGEVRSLAQRSAVAAKEIKSLIEDSAGRVAEGSKLADDAGKTMSEVVSSVKRLTDIMAEIASASREQFSGIEQVSSAVSQMDHVVQKNAALVEEAAAAAEHMSAQTEALSQSVARFRLDAKLERLGEAASQSVSESRVRLLGAGPDA